jgi:Uma2 family endonuclease
MATSAVIPVEEYLQTSYEPDMEYVDGELVVRNVGERQHGRLQGLIVALLMSRERQKRFHTFPEQRILVSGAKNRYRIPDVCVMALPYEKEPVFTRPPHLAIEVISPDDQVADILEKTADYLKAGIPHIWLVDPYKRTLQVVDPDGIRSVQDLVVETDLVGSVDFKELFAQVDEPTV